MNGVGSLSHLGLLDFTGFVHTQNKTSDFPDIQFHHFQYRMGEQKRLSNVLENYGYDENVRKSLMSGIEKSELLMVMVVLLKPKSVGKIELRSNDPLEKPRIFGNYFDEQEDVNTMIRGVNVVKRLIHTKSAKQHEAELLRVNLPGCAHIEFDKPGYWECYVRHMTSTVYHPTSTCKMGPDSDPEAVVDPRLKVHGLKNLRVIDASIMPDITSGNTNAPAIMIGEKGSDMIKDDWKEVHSEL
jgi:choline dehydrogenase-like flavoprotein